MGKKKAIIQPIDRPGHGKGFFVDFLYWQTEEAVQGAIAESTREYEADEYEVLVMKERQWDLVISPLEEHLNHWIEGADN